MYESACDGDCDESSAYESADQKEDIPKRPAVKITKVNDLLIIVTF